MRLVTPLGPRVLVKQVVGNQSSSAIYIPDSVEALLKEGIVISAGPGYRLNSKDASGDIFSPLQLRKGDRVMYDTNMQMHHIDLLDGDGKFIIMDESAIVAKLEEVPDGGT